MGFKSEHEVNLVGYLALLRLQNNGFYNLFYGFFFLSKGVLIK